MEKIGKEKSPFSTFDHVGVVVRDMDRAIEYYQSLGAGPFEPVTTPVAEKKISWQAYRGLRGQNTDGSARGHTDRADSAG